MLPTVDKKYNDIILKIGIIVLLLWPIFFVTKGVDAHDTGYYLANYKFYLSGELTPNISMALSNIVGALIYNIIPDAKLLIFRLLDWALNAFAWFLIIKMFKDHIPAIWLVPMMFIGEAMIRRYPMALSYNTFSFTFFILALYLLIKGLNEDKQKLINISGLIIGLNVFFRIPNALQAISVFMPLWYTVSGKNSLKKGFDQSLKFTLFGFIGLFTGFAIVAALLGVDNVLEGLKFLFNLSKSADSHGVGSMINRIFRELYDGFYFLLEQYKVIVAILVASIFYTMLRLRIKSKLRYVLYAFATAGVLFAGWWMARRINQANSVFIIVIVSFPLSLIGALIYIRTKPVLSLICLANIMLMMSAPLGTDNGLMHFNSVLPMVALSIVAVINNGNSAIRVLQKAVDIDYIYNKVGFTKTFAHMIKNAVMLLLAVFIVINMKAAVYDTLIKQTYGDQEYKNLNTTMDVPLLYGMQTYEEKALGLENYYKAIQEYGHEDKKLMVVGDGPIAHALSQHKPYFGEVWADLDVVPYDEFTQKLNDSAKNNDLPLILMADFNQVNNILKRKKWVFTSEFVNKNNYTLIAEDLSFKLYKAN